MQRRIIVLAVLVTLVYWLGHAAGCASAGQDQNYKLLEDDRPMFDTSPNRNQPGETRIPTPPAPYIATAPEPAEEVRAELAPAPQTDAPASDDAPAAIRTTMQVQGVEPSVTGLDRSHWPVVEVKPEPVDGPFCSLIWFCWE